VSRRGEPAVAGQIKVAGLLGWPPPIRLRALTFCTPWGSSRPASSCLLIPLPHYHNRSWWLTGLGRAVCLHRINPMNWDAVQAVAELSAAVGVPRLIWCSTVRAHCCERKVVDPRC
jgi:hypothetical protein